MEKQNNPHNQDNQGKESKWTFLQTLMIVFLPLGIALIPVTVLPAELKDLRWLIWVAYLLIIAFTAVYFVFIKKYIDKHESKKTAVNIVYWVFAAVIITACLFFMRAANSGGKEESYPPMEIQVEYRSDGENGDDSEEITNSITRPDEPDNTTED